MLADVHIRRLQDKVEGEVAELQRHKQKLSRGGVLSLQVACISVSSACWLMLLLSRAPQRDVQAQ